MYFSLSVSNSEYKFRGINFVTLLIETGTPALRLTFDGNGVAGKLSGSVMLESTMWLCASARLVLPVTRYRRSFFLEN